jgi:hypothetical protein
MEKSSGEGIGRSIFPVLRMILRGSESVVSTGASLDYNSMAGPETSASGTNLPHDLTAVKIHRLPSAAYYVADFISAEEEAQILEKVGIGVEERARSFLPRENLLTTLVEDCCCPQATLEESHSSKAAGLAV